MSINVINRRGESVPLKLETICDRLKQLAGMSPRLSVSTDTIAIKTVASLVDGIQTSEIDKISANICASLIIENPEFDDLAARITISDLHKNTTSDLRKYARDLVSYEYRGTTIRIMHPKVVAFIERYYQDLERVVDYDRDYVNNFFGAITLIKSYLLAYKYDNGVKFLKERPQQMLLRVAVGINMTLIGDDGYTSKETLVSIIDTYQLLADRYYTHATPTLFNAGTINHTLSSCYLLSIDDSLDNIYSRLTDISKISKFSGGVGVHMSQVRASGSVIASTIGRSEGLVPLMRVYNESTRYVSQGGGKRKGSTAVYLEPWHADIESAILSQKQQGAPERLCRDLFLALWVPDIFMIRLKQTLKTKQDVMWSLMCPHECPGLTDAYGSEFDKLYLKYEASGRFRRQISIKKLWDLIMSTQIETGKPYLMYKDHVNRKCNQNNLGVIKSSNLCVAGDTQILTEIGYMPIREVAGMNMNVWNGSEWSMAPIRQTNVDQTLYRVTMSDGSYLDCTAYHKFRINKDQKFVEMQTLDLMPGDISMRAKYYPIVLESTETNHLRFRAENDQYKIPHASRVFDKLLWLADQLDENAGYMQITSDNQELLREVKLFANTLGTNPFIAKSPRGFHLRFPSVDVETLLVDLMLPIEQTPKDYKFLKQPDIKVVSIEEIPGSHDTFCFNEPKRHLGIFNGMLTSQCAEITIHSDTNNVGVCNLASVCLPKFVQKIDETITMDYEQLYQVVQKIVFNMNKVMDNNKYPLNQARNSDNKNRPIGIGVQGLSEVFMMMKTPFDSPIATDVNKKIFETMYYAALVASNKLAQVHGQYETFPSSMTAQGLLQFDLWDVRPSDLWDWASLRSDIKIHGLRNSLLMALMPTAGTSIISGHTEGAEPPQSNLFTRSTLSGRFQVVNKYLVSDLKALGLWTRTIRNKIIENDGSVQGIEEIPLQVREIYKTIYEYKLTSLIKMNADREAYVCQSASNNRYLSSPDVGILTNMHLYSWKYGLKTSSYYVRVKMANSGKKLLEKEEECLSCQA